MKKIRLTVKQLMALSSFFNNLCVKENVFAAVASSATGATTGAVDVVNAICNKKGSNAFKAEMPEVFLKRLFSCLEFALFSFGKNGIFLSSTKKGGQGFPNKESYSYSTSGTLASVSNGTVLEFRKQLIALLFLYIKNLSEVKIKDVEFSAISSSDVFLSVKFSCAIVKKKRLNFLFPLNSDEMGCLEKVLRSEFCEVALEKLTASFVQNIVAKNNNLVFHLASVLSEIQEIVNCFLKEKCCFLSFLSALCGIVPKLPASVNAVRRTRKIVRRNNVSKNNNSNAYLGLEQKMLKRGSKFGFSSFRQANTPINNNDFLEETHSSIGQPVQIKGSLAIPNVVYFSLFLSKLFNSILKGTI